MNPSVAVLKLAAKGKEKLVQLEVAKKPLEKQDPYICDCLGLQPNLSTFRWILLRSSEIF